MIDLSSNAARLALVERMQADVDAFCREEFADDPRTHLGASIIGHDCSAYLWNTFRWLKFEDFCGQQLRLFNRGHEEEARFIRWLVGIGFQVREIDPATQRQYRISGSKGHFGGSLDALMLAPERYGIPDGMIWLGEFKTHNENSFKDLAGPKRKDKKMRVGGKGVARSKPKHFRQMNSYGKAYQTRYGLYCAVNKETDELYFEIVELDWLQADDMYRKADGIIFSQTQAPKIARTPAFKDCKICDFVDICHGGAQPTKNCRSCVHAFPIDDAQWFCELYSPKDGPIPKEAIPHGCSSWVRII